MLLANTELLFDDPFAFFVLLVAVAASLTIGITFHEFAHAYAANKQGDPTAARLGRLTLNPLAHLDPTGSVMVLIAGFGWGRPVPVNPLMLKDGRRGMAIVSFAGPFSNMVVALALTVLFQTGLLTAGDFTRESLSSVDALAWVTLIASFSVLLNLILATFNLLPIPPLDGGGILAGIVPESMLPAVAKLQRIGPVILIAVIASTFLTDLNILRYLFSPVLDLADILVTSQF
ncbi:MAG: site-2 protease family protein [Dehalococcoidia bacterium]